MDEDRESWNFNDLMQLDNVDGKFYIGKASNVTGGALKNLPKCCVSMCAAIRGDSLNDILGEKKKGNDRELVNKVLMASVQFYNFLQYMGLHKGMLHNDLHLGNMFYNHNTEQIVMIDYGRVHFANPDVSGELNDFIKREVHKFGIDLYKDEYTYASVVGEFHEHMKSDKTKWNNKYPLHIADLMTFAGNMYIFFLGTVGESFSGFDIKESIDQFIRFDYNDNPTWLKYRKINMIVPNNARTIYVGYVNCVNQITKLGIHGDIKQAMINIAEGLFYIACLIYKTLTFHFRSNEIECWLHNNDLFHSHFQYIGSTAQLSKFVNWVLMFKDDLKDKSTFMKNLTEGEGMISGGSRKKMSMQKRNGGAVGDVNVNWFEDLPVDDGDDNDMGLINAFVAGADMKAPVFHQGVTDDLVNTNVINTMKNNVKNTNTVKNVNANVKITKAEKNAYSTQQPASWMDQFKTFVAPTPIAVATAAGGKGGQRNKSVRVVKKRASAK
jgi:hypothetical protein